MRVMYFDYYYKEVFHMIIKKKLAAAVAAVCVLTSGVLPNALSTQAIGAKNWLDLSLKVSSNNVKPGEKVEVTVVALGFNGDSDIGGMQIKLNDDYASSSEKAEGLKLVEIRHGEDQLPAKSVFSNTDYGEFAMWSGVEGTTIKETQNVNLVTYVYEVPDFPADSGYGFSVDQGYTFFCDPDGNEIQYEAEFSYANITLDNGKGQSGEIGFVVDYPENLAPGQVFTANVLYKGDPMKLAGFQFDLDVPSEFEFIGMASNINTLGMPLTFNPKTMELASSTGDGSERLFADNTVVASFNFRAPQSSIPAGKKITVKTDSIEASDANGKTITPGGADVPVGEGLLGDANLDGKVDSSDASAVLGEYSELATSGNTTFKKPQQKINADVNFDNKIDSKDASDILAYYSFLSTGGKGTMENWIANYKNK